MKTHLPIFITLGKTNHNPPATCQNGQSLNSHTGCVKFSKIIDTGKYTHTHTDSFDLMKWKGVWVDASAWKWLEQFGSEPMRQRTREQKIEN